METDSDVTFSMQWTHWTFVLFGGWRSESQCWREWSEESQWSLGELAKSRRSRRCECGLAKCRNQLLESKSLHGAAIRWYLNNNFQGKADSCLWMTNRSTWHWFEFLEVEVANILGPVFSGSLSNFVVGTKLCPVEILIGVLIIQSWWSLSVYPHQKCKCTFCFFWCRVVS